MGNVEAIVIEESLFEDTYKALVFAFNYSGEQYDRPLMNRMSDGPQKAGKGLSGVDGAAQSGFIRSEVAALGRLFESTLIARIAPKTIPCQCKKSCCRGHKANPEWRTAIAFLADHMRTHALAGCTSTSLLRSAYVELYFSHKSARARFDRIAEVNNVDRRTVSAHYYKISALLGGVPARGERAAELGLEAEAFNAIDGQLRACGMVGGD